MSYTPSANNFGRWDPEQVALQLTEIGHSNPNLRDILFGELNDGASIFSRLPNEIQLRVFKLLSTRRRQLVQISLVCKGWHMFCLRSPTLWAHIRVHSKRLKWMQAELLRSRGAPIELEISLLDIDENEMNFIMTFTTHCVHRIGTITLYANDLALLTRFFHGIPAATSLKTLDLHYTGTLDTLGGSLIRIAPALREVRLHGVIVDWSDTMTFFQSHLSRLCLGSISGLHSPAQFLQAVRRCYNLTELVLDEAVIAAGSMVDPLVNVDLPSLQKLCMRGHPALCEEWLALFPRLPFTASYEFDFSPKKVLVAKPIRSAIRNAPSMFADELSRIDHILTDLTKGHYAIKLELEGVAKRTSEHRLAVWMPGGSQERPYVEIHLSYAGSSILLDNQCLSPRLEYLVLRDFRKDWKVPLRRFLHRNLDLQSIHAKSCSHNVYSDIIEELHQDGIPFSTASTSASRTGANLAPISCPLLRSLRIVGETNDTLKKNMRELMHRRWSDNWGERNLLCGGFLVKWKSDQ